MGNLFYWILASFVFGLFAGLLYTWMSPRHTRWQRLLMRSAAAYTAIALAIVYVMFLFDR